MCNNLTRDQVYKNVQEKHHFSDYVMASQEIRDDVEFFKRLTEKRQYILEHCIMVASEKIKNNKEIIGICVKSFGDFFQYASNNLKDDEEYVFQLAICHTSIIQYISTRLKSKKSFILKIFSALKKDRCKYGYLLEYLIEPDDEIIYKCLDDYPLSILNVSLHRSNVEKYCRFILRMNDEYFFSRIPEPFRTHYIDLMKLHRLSKKRLATFLDKQDAILKYNIYFWHKDISFKMS